MFKSGKPGRTRAVLPEGQSAGGPGVSRRSIWIGGLGATAGSVLLAPARAVAATRVDDAAFLQLAAEPTALMVGEIRRDKRGSIISASVLWPDGVAGVFAADEIDDRHGAVNAYHVTYGTLRSYVQPLVMRDVAGRVVHRPPLQVL